MDEEQIKVLIDEKVRQDALKCGCEESQLYLKVLVRLRAEFDYLFAQRENNANYAAMLEVMVENRLSEVRMWPRMFGADGVAGLPMPYGVERDES